MEPRGVILEPTDIDPVGDVSEEGYREMPGPKRAPGYGTPCKGPPVCPPEPRIQLPGCHPGGTEDDVLGVIVGPVLVQQTVLAPQPLEGSCSRVGCVLNLDVIPKPPGVELLTWLECFLSYGFVLCVDDEKISSCLEPFQKKGLSAEVIGRVQQESRVVLNYRGNEEVLYDLGKESILGV